MLVLPPGLTLVYDWHVIWPAWVPIFQLGGKKINAAKRKSSTEALLRATDGPPAWIEILCGTFKVLQREVKGVRAVRSGMDGWDRMIQW